MYIGFKKNNHFIPPFCNIALDFFFFFFDYYNIYMLLDTRKKSTDAQEGFNPNVQNDVVAAGAPAGGLVLFILLSIITIGIFAACA
jgi:hypothetical protein